MISDSELHPGCILCKQRNTAQADVIDPETGRVIARKGDFIIQCKGIPKDPLVQIREAVSSLGLGEEFGEEEIESLAMVKDPVLWAAKNVTVLDEETGERGPWIPQGATQANIEKYGLDPSASYYQELMVKCTARRQLARLGRRCMPATERVAMKSGLFKSIAEISPGDEVLAKNAKGRFVSKKVLSSFKNGIQQIFKIRLNDGSSVRVTDNHPLLKFVKLPGNTGRKLVWSSISDGLVVGDKVQVAIASGFFGDLSFVDEAKMIGYLLTDGYLPAVGQTPKFTNTNILYHNEVDSLSFSIFGERGHLREKQSDSLPAWDYYFTDGDKGTSSFIKTWLSDLGILGQKAVFKTIPEKLFLANRETVAAFINRMWSGDGCVYIGQSRSGRKKALELALTSASLQVLKDTRLLLRKFGIVSRIKKEPNRDNWKLCITGKTDIETFFREIGLIFGKEQKSREALEELSSLTRQARNTGYKETRLARIVSIEPDGEEETFDIEVDKWHNFLVDGVITHNSGKSWTITIKALHKMMCTANYRILVITPNISQLDLIFNRVNDFIDTSPQLQGTKEVFRKTPHRYLELANGSYMIGFVSGNDAIRGQAGDMIIIDEADYLTTDDLSAITAILTEHRETILLVASTPTGKREQFYKWDHDPTFRSFHFPSMCRPKWDDNMEIEQRKELPGVKYLHEIKSEYGEIAEGVFQHSHVDRSIEQGDYTYPTQTRDPDWIYCMGVDWNPVNGTEIVVTGIDPNAKQIKYTPVDCGQVYREGNTQTQAIAEIIALNKKWMPEWIYVDRGAGSVQIELLEQVGTNAPPNTPEKRLQNIIKAIDFGSKIEMRHPVDGTIIKTYAKPAIVENAIRLMEADQIVLSKYDTNLIRAIRGFVIDKISQNGRPVYKMVSDDIEDHRLDAWLLSLFAFTMEYSKLGRPAIIPSVGFTGLPGEISIPVSESISLPSRDDRPKSRAIESKQDKHLSKHEIEKERELNFIPVTTTMQDTLTQGYNVTRVKYTVTPTDTSQYGWKTKRSESGRSSSRQRGTFGK